jgi:hypothetical protein
MVPLSEDVASSVPSLFNVINESGDRWASTTFIASNLIVSNMSTSPLVGDMWLFPGGA